MFGKYSLIMVAILLSQSVWPECAKCHHLGKNLTVFVIYLRVYLPFWQNHEPNLAICWYWANFRYRKWSNIRQIILQSGHTDKITIVIDPFITRVVYVVWTRNTKYWYLATRNLKYLMWGMGWENEKGVH